VLAVVELPAAAAARHLGLREGFETLFVRRDGESTRLEGHVAAVADERAWALRYLIRLDGRGVTREAEVAVASEAGDRSVTILGDGSGQWSVDGRPRPELDGCLDVDLEASAFTNAFPIRRLGLDEGEEAEAPAAWVRAPHLAVERLEQRYRRVASPADRLSFDYAAPELAFGARLSCDPGGLTLEYEGLATRVA
jgi:hypothetical protein